MTSRPSVGAEHQAFRPAATWPDRAAVGMAAGGEHQPSPRHAEDVAQLAVVLRHSGIGRRDTGAQGTPEHRAQRQQRVLEVVVRTGWPPAARPTGQVEQGLPMLRARALDRLGVADAAPVAAVGARLATGYALGRLGRPVQAVGQAGGKAPAARSSAASVPSDAARSAPRRANGRPLAGGARRWITFASTLPARPSRKRAAAFLGRRRRPARSRPSATPRTGRRSATGRRCAAAPASTAKLDSGALPAILRASSSPGETRAVGHHVLRQAAALALPAASSTRPVSIMSVMVATPCRRGTRAEPPPPTKMPRWPRAGRSRCSPRRRGCGELLASSSPPPTTAPCSTATTGTRPNWMASIAACHCASARCPRHAALLSSDRSSPAQKCSPAAEHHRTVLPAALNACAAADQRVVDGVALGRAGSAGWPAAPASRSSAGRAGSVPAAGEVRLMVLILG